MTSCAALQGCGWGAAARARGGSALRAEHFSVAVFVARLDLGRPFLRPSGWHFGINQNEGDPARLGAVVDPGVIGALLHQYIAGFDVDLAVVEQHVDLAVEHDRVIDRLGAMGIGMPAIALRRRVNSHRHEDLMMIDRRRVRRYRCEIDDAEDRAVGARWHADLRLRAIRSPRYVDRKLDRKST